MEKEGSELYWEFEEEAKKSLAPKQFEYINAYRRLKSVALVAREFGIGEKTISQSLKAASQKLGYAHYTHVVDENLRSNFTQKKSLRALLLNLLEEQQFRCALSGVRLTPETAVVDHKLPVSEGGSKEISNLQWLHCDVNRAKGTLNNDEFINLCNRISEMHRSTKGSPG